MALAARSLERHYPDMKAAMDAAGRIVIPKALRLALGFQPGQVREFSGVKMRRPGRSVSPSTATAFARQ